MNSTILEKFTKHFKQVIYNAFRLAQSTPDKIIKPEHLLWGLLQQKGSLAAELLKKVDLKMQIETHTSYPITEPTPSFDEASLFPFSTESQKIIERAVLTAAHYEHRYIGTEHLLASLIAHPDDHLTRIFSTQRIGISELSEHVKTVLSSTSRLPEIVESTISASRDPQKNFPPSMNDDTSFERTPSSPTPLTPPKDRTKRKRKTPALDFFATDLTAAAAQQHIDPVIGRDREINRVIQILGRRTKNNPVLLGDPGVGKTAIVEGLAKRIAQGAVPDLLLKKKIYSLDVTLLVAGAIYRGEFESRLKQVLEENKNDPNLILFIDEIHTIIGAGTSNSGSLDAANILKPALARGQVRCIGATTWGEYKKYIEGDPALERRFQPVRIAEVTPDEAVNILAGIKHAFELHHGVHISDDAIRASVELSHRYIPDKFLPDKAIDLIDEAASRLRLSLPVSRLAQELNTLETQLETIRRKKEDAVARELFPEALSLKEQEQQLISRIESATSPASPRRLEGTLTASDIAHIVSDITNVPLSHITATPSRGTAPRQLDRSLKRLIIGQDDALTALLSTLKRAHAGLSGHERPLGSFIFFGPSGVGKTETAKKLAELMFGSRDALIRFDMSEYSESFNISKLIGAPAGYVGYHEGGKLTEIIRRQPYALILFDEIEKAHPDVFNILLQILDDGHLTDASGKKVNFKNTLIVMTSNIGIERFNRGAALGFESATPDASSDFTQLAATVLEEAKQSFRPEFINRIDRLVVFRPLSKSNLMKICELQLRDLASRVQHDHRIALTWDRTVLEHIARTSFSPEQGARGIRKYLIDHVETPLADILTAQRNTPPSSVKISLDGDTLSLVS